MKSFRIGLVTWNVGGAPPGITPGTSDLLRVAAHCDVVVAGLQEVAVGRRGWKAQLAKGLGTDWVYVGGESYAGMRVKVFARVSARLPDHTSIQLSALSAQDAARVGLSVRAGRYPVVGVAGAGKRVGVGVADRWPNKGAVALEIRFGQACRAMFVVAHLAANEDRLQGREDDWRAILRRLDRDDLPLARGADPVIAVPLFHRYEHVFVLGDLNYRIAPPGTDHIERVKWVQQRVQKHDWQALVDADQLMQEKMGDKVFANFQEGEINFPPTFKIDPKTGQYSVNRVPSYCDRILWHSLPARVDLVKCVQYTSLVNFKQSDHIPVFGEYELRVPLVVSPARPLNPLKGKRVVLEFMLVRFVKGAGKFTKRDSFTDGPPSMRRIKEPERLHFPATDEFGVRIEHGSFLDNLEDDDDEDDIVLDADDEDDDDDDTSSVSSEEEDFYTAIGNENDEGNYSPYESPDVAVEAEDLHIFGCRAGSGDEPRYDMALLGNAFRHVSTSSSTDMSAPYTPSPHHSDKDLWNRPGNTPGGSSTDRTATTNRDSPRPTAHANSGPRKRDSLSRQVENNMQNKKVKKRRRWNGMRMEVHGQGLFLKQGRVYRVGIPKRMNGARERIGESLPVIPLMPIQSLGELEYRHVLVEFAKKKTRVGTSGALALRELLGYMGRPFAFELSLTKYGLPVGILEACVQLTVSDSDLWVDAKGRVVRNRDGSASRFYRGVLPVRKRTRARSKADGTRP